MSRKILILILVAGLAISFLLNSHKKMTKVYGMPNFTVITRTPTPPPQAPTATPQTNPSNPNPPPPSNATDEPTSPTHTVTPVIVTQVATPAGGYWPTAVACGTPPTVQSRNNTNVRSGPGTDYDIVGRLVHLETRIIIGRASNSEWWSIQFSDEETGWVANDVVIVHGNINGIPILSPSEINGETPTPGALWQPTPNPECPDIPTHTPTPTITVVQTATATETTAPPTNTPKPEKEAEATATSVIPTAVETTDSTEAKATLTPQPTAVPLDEDNTPSTASVLPCSAAIIGLAAIGFLAFKRIF
ncbi:MAG: hypothetical protein CSB13_07080 [Chloroflexi bacterium]|nr:MAG: hypothetical protein CSB13_07080 [Chloroflexota bacterium]